MQSPIEFGHFRIEPDSRTLFRGGTPVKVGARAFDLLCALAAAGGEVVSKEALMDQVWPGQVIEENALQAQISTLRKVLDPDNTDIPYLVTVPHRGYRLFLSRSDSSSSGEETSTSDQNVTIPGTSIAVLPFQNLTSDPEQDYFADGVVEDIISGLARSKWLFVIARNFSFSYKGRQVDVRQVGRDLGVRYLLEGSIRKTETRRRVTCQLLEAKTGTHILTERYDRLIDDIFEVQDDITEHVVGAIEPNLKKVEIDRVRRKRPENLDAYDLVLRALPHVHTRMAKDAAVAIRV